MTNQEYPKQPTPEKKQPTEQKPKNDTGDLALLAEFYAEQFDKRAKSTPEGTIKNEFKMTPLK